MAAELSSDHRGGIAARLGIALLRGVGRLPFRAVGALGAGLGGLAYLLPSQRRRVGRINLALCFPELDSGARERLLRRHFAALGQMVLEYGYCWFAPRQTIERLVRIEGRERLDAHGQRPLILAMPHFAGLDLAGLRLSLETPLVSVYSRQKSPWLDAFMRERRLRFGTGMVFPRQAGIRPALQGLRQGLRLFYLPDQDHGSAGAVFAPFFGTPAASITATSRIAALTGAVVLPCWLRRDAGGYTVVIEPPLADFPSPDPALDTVRLNQLIEQQVRRQPQQYFWLHRRFKTRPAGERPVYEP
jgi:KDO2-lipid IV(A) lauroyltransferase